MNAFTPSGFLAVPISLLPQAQTLDGSEAFPVVQNGITCQAPTGSIPLRSYAGQAIPVQVQPLTYVATQGQTHFPLYVADKRGATATLTATNQVEVFAGGSRLARDDGTGFGGYIVDFAGNQIVLLNAAIAGLVVQIDVIGVIAPIVGVSGATEPVTVTGTNAVAPLKYAPDGSILLLFVDGRAFVAVGAHAAFSVNGNQITWTSAAFTILPTSEVICVYTHV
jgi:hypothetical protein